jgi:hypothetical protein
MEGEVVSVGQARGFDESYQACYGRLLRQVALVTADLADAEDVLQEAYARTAIRWRQLETDDAPEAWVLRVAMNLAADTTRRLRRRAAAMLRLGPPPTQPELSADSVDLIRALAALPLGGNAKRSCCTTWWVVRWTRSVASLASHQGPSRRAWLVDAPPSPAGLAPISAQFTGDACR